MYESYYHHFDNDVDFYAHDDLNHSTLDIFRLLLDRGANAEATTNDDLTPLYPGIREEVCRVCMDIDKPVSVAAFEAIV